MGSTTQLNMRGCHRFRDTCALDFSPFTSLAEVNSATVQSLTAGSLHTNFASPSLANKGRYTLRATDRKDARPGHFRTKSTSPPRSIDSALSISSSSHKEFRFEPQATSTECRRSHQPQSLQAKLPPWSEPSSHLEVPGDASPPPYSDRKSFAPTQSVSTSSEAKWNYQELNNYSELDLETEILSSRYTQCVDLAFEEYYHGKRITYGFTRKYNSGKRKTSRESLTVIVPPGCQSDTVFCFSNVGHQLEDGTYQDIHLIFVERPHPLRFYRSGANLLTCVRLPWSDHLKEAPMRFSLTNVDGKKYSLEVDYRASKMVAGSAVFQEAGMPRLDGDGRGTLRIEWEIATSVQDETSL